MSEHDLGPKPDAEIEPGEPNPGGADAIEDSDGVDTEAAGGDGVPEPLPRDLDPDHNPAVEDALPEEMKQREDTSTEATEDDGGDEGSGDVPPEEEAPA